MKEPVSQGKCPYCNSVVLQDEMSRHLAAHLKQNEKDKKAGPTKVYHLKIDSGSYFLHILAKDNCKFRALDDFLRDTWVECCDHLSAFNHKNLDIRMKRRMKDVLSPRMKIDYEYDFGSTTYLDITVHKSYSLPVKANITLLSRNEPLEWPCEKCGRKTAVEICLTHLYEDSDALFCEDCIPVHEQECEDFSDEMRLPVVNSPRMGVCGYDGH